eukprot:gene25781-31540_t
MRTRSAARQERPCDPRSAVDATLRHIGGLAAAALLVAPGAGLAAEDLALGFFEVPRCSVEALSKAANTRASFSDFATESNPELYVNIEGCDYSGLDLSKEVRLFGLADDSHTPSQVLAQKTFFLVALEKIFKVFPEGPPSAFWLSLQSLP